MIKENKQKLRLAAKEKLARLFADQKLITERRLRLINEIRELEEYKQAKIILFYYPLADELDLTALPGLDRDKIWVLPRAIGDSRMLCFEFTKRSELKTDRYGVQVPPATNRLVKPNNIDLIIIPALAFDKSSYRLGRGGGYYDRFLSKLYPLRQVGKGITVGVSLSEMVYDSLPHAEHDHPVDKLISV